MDEKARLAEVCRQALESMKHQDPDTNVKINENLLMYISGELIAYYARMVDLGLIKTKNTKH